MKAEAIPNGASVLETLKTRVQLCSGEQSWGISQGLAFGGLGLLDQESGNQSCRCPALLRGVGIVWDWDEEKGIREFRRSALFVTSEESKKKEGKKKREKKRSGSLPWISPSVQEGLRYFLCLPLGCKT